MKIVATRCQIFRRLIGAMPQTAMEQLTALPKIP